MEINELTSLIVAQVLIIYFTVELRSVKSVNNVILVVYAVSFLAIETNKTTQSIVILFSRCINLISDTVELFFGVMMKVEH